MNGSWLKLCKFYQLARNGSTKASLNAPLLDWLFWHNPNVESIVHYHEIEAVYPIRQYAPPGTVKDTERSEKTSFNVSGHGVFLLIDKDGNII